MIPLQIEVDREKDGASFREVRLPAHSLPCHRFRRACMRAHVHVVRVCVYMCMYVCTDMYICIHAHVYMYMYTYACTYMCIRTFIHICR